MRLCTYDQGSFTAGGCGCEKGEVVCCKDCVDYYVCELMNSACKMSSGRFCEFEKEVQEDGRKNTAND